MYSRLNLVDFQINFFIKAIKILIEIQGGYINKKFILKYKNKIIVSI